MNNPLDDLLNQPSPLPTRTRTGRRELRQQLLARGITLRVRPASVEDQVKMAKGEFVGSLPIRRKEEKRMGMSKKEWKAYKRSLRNPTS